MAIEVENNKPIKKSSVNINISVLGSHKITSNERMFFVEQLALMLETGSDLHSSLDILAQQYKNPELVRVISEIKDSIGEGKNFCSSIILLV